LKPTAGYAAFFLAQKTRPSVISLILFVSVELSRNPFATVTRGFYAVSAHLFATLIAAKFFCAWLFYRVEIDES